MSRLKKIIIGLLVFLVLFTVTGFFIVPPVAKSVLVKKMSQELQRDISIEKISFNPFRFTLTVRGFVIRERDKQEPFVSFREMFVNLEGMSLFKKSVIIDEFRLTGPYVHLVRLKDGSYNISDLLAKTKKDPQEKDTPPLRFSVNNIRIEAGKAVFQDAPRNVLHSADQIQVGIPFISNMTYHTDTFVKPSFHAVINGAPYTLKGNTKPFKNNRQTELDIKISRIDIPYYLAYAPEKLNFKLVSASLDVDVKVFFRQENGGKQFLGLGGQLALNDIALDEMSGQALLRLPALRIALGDVAPLDRTYHLAKLVLTSPELHVRRDKQGKINLLGLFPPKTEQSPAQITTPESSGEPPAGNKILVDLDTLLIEKGKLHYEDHKPATPVNLSLPDYQLTGLNLSTAPGKEGKATLNVTLPKQGSISLAGPITISPMSGKLVLDIQRLDVPLFQPYIGDILNVQVTGGKLGAQGDLIVNTVDKELKVGYTGKVFLTRFASIDTVSANDLLKWRSLYLNGVDLGSNPLRVHIRGVALSDFYSRIIVRPDGTLNLQHLAREKKPELQKGEASDKIEKSAIDEEKRKARGDIRIGSVTLQGGEIDFLDSSIKPQYSKRFMEMGGRVSNLSSLENSRGDVELRGKLDGYAPLEITGKINPLQKDLFVDLKAVFKNMDLSPMTPYSGKYIGYEIQKGKLSFDLKYLIERRKLDSTNIVFIDQLNLGDRVDSPDATKLPVALAVSLLKDRHGQIKLDIPVKGSLDDPEFSVWRIIVKVLKNLLGKAATAPFALLGSLLGGGEELSYVEFDAGLAVLDEANMSKISTLSKALADRPSLKIDLEGYVDAEQDREATKKIAFERKVKVQKLNDLIRAGKTDVKLEGVVVGQEEYEKYLRKAYNAEKFPKPRNLIGLAKKLPVPEMEKLMYTYLEVKDDDLRLLANQRTLNVRDVILAAADVAPERIFIVEAKYLSPPDKEKLKKSRVDFRLK